MYGRGLKPAAKLSSLEQMRQLAFQSELLHSIVKLLVEESDIDVNFQKALEGFTALYIAGT